jgi:predicted anti-sigma-YlaC factor YlaD
MKCNLVRDLICDYLEGDLQQEMISAFEMHLESCPACREETEVMRVAFQALDEAPEPSLSENFTDNLMASLPTRESILCQETRRRRLSVTAVVSMVVVALLSWNFLFVNFFSQINRDSRLMLNFRDTTLVGFKQFVVFGVKALGTAGDFVRTLGKTSEMILETPLAYQALIVFIVALLSTMTLLILHRRNAVKSTSS